MRPRACPWGGVLVLLPLAGLCKGFQQSSGDQSTGVCESRTINYITHSLPQQCLRTGRPSTSTTQTDREQVSQVAGDSVPLPTSTSSLLNTIAPAGSATTDQDGTTASNPTSITEAADAATPTFMSFEDWKEMMLRKTGQDPNDLKGRRPPEQRPDRDAAYGDGALDSLGDDGEISLNFEPYAEQLRDLATATDRTGDELAVPDDTAEAEADGGLTQYTKSKDAGKTCKERFSYASFDAGATVLKTSPGTKNAKAILVENKDSYLLLECTMDNKYVIVELSDDILVDTVVIANFEFFSSMVRHFRVSVSERYPVKLDKWKVLGTFEAKNSRDIQPFLVENPLIYAKYFRIEFLTHYGNEYYCPVSLLRVHGSRMVESWKESEGLRDDDDSEVEAVNGSEPLNSIDGLAELSVASASVPLAPEMNDSTAPTDLWVQWDVDLFGDSNFEVCVATAGTPTPWPTNDPVASSEDGASNVTIQISVEASSATPQGVPMFATADPVSSETPAAVLPPSIQSIGTDVTSAGPPPANSTVPPSSRSSPALEESPTPASSVMTKAPSISPATTSKNKTSTTAAVASGTPTVQESFFKTVTKRLQYLEANITLSLKYIEDQSKLLQDALLKAEKKQLSKVDLFLDALNDTVFSELRSVRQQYDQVWQSTVIALESQREHSEHELIALSSRLNILADEVVFQKRMSILQSVLLLSCLVLIIFSRTLVVPTLAPVPGSSISLPASPIPSVPYASSYRDEDPIGELGLSQERNLSRQSDNHGAKGPYFMTHGVLSSPSISTSLDAEDAPSKLSYEDQAIARRLSPPMSPSPLDGPNGRSSSSRGRGYEHLGDSRKPLPALPEHPD